MFIACESDVESFCAKDEKGLKVANDKRRVHTLKIPQRSSMSDISQP